MALWPCMCSANQNKSPLGTDWKNKQLETKRSQSSEENGPGWLLERLDSISDRTDEVIRSIRYQLRKKKKKTKQFSDRNKPYSDRGWDIAQMIKYLFYKHKDLKWQRIPCLQSRSIKVKWIDNCNLLSTQSSIVTNLQGDRYCPTKIAGWHAPEVTSSFHLDIPAYTKAQETRITLTFWFPKWEQRDIMYRHNRIRGCNKNESYVLVLVLSLTTGIYKSRSQIARIMTEGLRRHIFLWTQKSSKNSEDYMRKYQVDVSLDLVSEIHKEKTFDSESNVSSGMRSPSETGSQWKQ